MQNMLDYLGVLHGASKLVVKTVKVIMPVKTKLFCIGNQYSQSIDEIKTIGCLTPS